MGKKREKNRRAERRVTPPSLRSFSLFVSFSFPDQRACSQASTSTTTSVRHAREKISHACTYACIHVNQQAVSAIVVSHLELLSVGCLLRCLKNLMQ